MLTETDDEALEAESRANALLDGATAYEAGVWRDLQGGRQAAASSAPSRNAWKRCRCRRGSRNERGWCARYAFTEEEKGRVSRWYVPVPVGALGEPVGVKVKRIIEDSDAGSCRFHLIVDTTTSNCRHHHIPYPDHN
jgi:hypothetical protein